MSATRSAFTAQTDSAAAARELVAGLGDADPRVVVFFAGVKHDGAVLGAALAERFPGARVLGGSTNGEFCDRGHGKGGAAALAISREQIGACAVALARVGEDVDAGVRAAADAYVAAIDGFLGTRDPELARLLLVAINGLLVQRLIDHRRTPLAGQLPHLLRLLPASPA